MSDDVGPLGLAVSVIIYHTYGIPLALGTRDEQKKFIEDGGDQTD